MPGPDCMGPQGVAMPEVKELFLSLDNRKKLAKLVYDLLDSRYPDSRPLLHFSSPFELLIGVILSAQTTDRQVNEVSPALFRHFPDAVALGRAAPEEVEPLIHSTGFYRQKAKSIIGTAARITEVYGGEVPGSMEDLLTLPGVGRKSANVVLGHVFDEPAIIVDTHFSRVVRRLGLSGETAPERIETELTLAVEPEEQTRFSMIVNYHGRDTCFALKPECPYCPLKAHCLHYASLKA